MQQILSLLVVQHADALDAAQLAASLLDVHKALRSLLAAQRALLSSQQAADGWVGLIGKLTKHLARLVVELQKRSPLALRAGLLPAFLQLFLEELEGAATYVDRLLTLTTCQRPLLSHLSASVIHSHSGPYADALLWAEDPADPCRQFYLSACAFLGNCVTCSDYVLDEEEEEETSAGEGNGNGNGGARQQRHGISFEGTAMRGIIVKMVPSQN